MSSVSERRKGDGEEGWGEEVTCVASLGATCATITTGPVNYMSLIMSMSQGAESCLLSFLSMKLPPPRGNWCVNVVV